MTRCLTQQQIDGALIVVLTGTCVVLVGAIIWVMVWAGPWNPRPYDRRRLVSALPALGFLVFGVLSGRQWEVLAGVATSVLVAAVGVVERHRAIAYASQGDMSAGWRRGHLLAKYGSPVLTVCGFLVAVGALVWVIPADLCR